PPFDRLADRVAHLLITPEDVSIRRLGRRINRGGNKRQYEQDERLHHLRDLAYSNDAYPDSDASRFNVIAVYTRLHTSLLSVCIQIVWKNLRTVSLRRALLHRNNRATAIREIRGARFAIHSAQ